MEILAPAGSLEILKVAIQAGCDAVYISGKDFGARKYANNFTEEEMIEAVSYAHLRNVKIYVTVNTIIYDNEFEKLHYYLEFLESIKVDAVIVQDLGVIYYIRKHFPKIIVHASTQMNIHNVSGAKKLMELGVKRVVLARETSIDMVKKIIDLGIEVEIFGHGALCFSQSGQCLMSYYIGKRSGNRGECAQPCRRTYKLIENNNNISDFVSLISMKDLNTLDYIDEFNKMGVTSLKIEGRMKSAQYVSTVINTYKSKLIGTNVKDAQKKLALAFNRKFTKGYILNENNNNVTNLDSVNHNGIEIGKIVDVNKKMICLTSKENLVKGDAIRIKSHNDNENYEVGFYINDYINDDETYYIKGNYQVKVDDIVYKVIDNSQTLFVNELLNDEKYQISLTAKLDIKLNSALKLTLFNNDLSIQVETDLITEVANKPMNPNRLMDQLSKTDSKLIKIEDSIILYDEISFVPISSINNIRRIALNKWIERYLNNYKLPQNEVFNDSIIKNDNWIIPMFEFVVHTKEQYDWCVKNRFTTIYNYLDNSYNRHFNVEDNMNKHIMVHNLADFHHGNVLSPSCNVVNSHQLQLLNRYDIDVVYLSNELEIEEIKELATTDINYNLGIMVYGKPEMLVSKHCFINKIKNFKHTNCGSCKSNQYMIEDEYHNLMKVYAKCDNNIPELTIHHYKTIKRFNFIKELEGTNVSRFLIMLTDETKDDLEKLLRMIRREGDYIG